MQSEVAVTMAPLDPELSEVIFSDKHWLIENALCLLSNAVKYSSEGGTVQLTTELVLMRQTNEEGEVEITPVGNRQSDLDCSSNSNSATDSTSDSPIVGAFVCHNEDFPYETLVQAVAQSKINEKAISVMLAAAQEERTELMIRITVEDTGIGIPDDVKCCLFQPFAQAQRFAGGTGLGLYSLAKRIDALGGMYGVRDRDDGQSGTVFWFCFPYRPDFTTTTLTTPLNELAGEVTKKLLQPLNLTLHSLSPPVFLLISFAPILSSLFQCLFHFMLHFPTLAIGASKREQLIFKYPHYFFYVIAALAPSTTERTRSIITKEN